MEQKAENDQKLFFLKRNQENSPSPLSPRHRSPRRRRRKNNKKEKMSEQEQYRYQGAYPAGQYQYGTFQGVANYYPPFPPPPPHHVGGFPPPFAAPASPPAVNVYIDHYQGVAGYPVYEGAPLTEPRLPFCGIGSGWFLFFLGFFFAGIPWYIGTFILLCARLDYREKPGYIACVIASILAMIAFTFGTTKGSYH